MKADDQKAGMLPFGMNFINHIVRTASEGDLLASRTCYFSDCGTTNGKDEKYVTNFRDENLLP